MRDGSVTVFTGPVGRGTPSVNPQLEPFRSEDESLQELFDGKQLGIGIGQWEGRTDPTREATLHEPSALH